MDIRFLESLAAVVEQGSIAGAARAQNLTPAAVSQRIQALEREFDKELLTRVAHRAKPTEACLNLLPRSLRLISEARLLRNDLDPAGLSGTLNIGAISTVLSGMMPKALQAMAHSFPNIKPKIAPGNSANLYRDFQADLLDAILIEMPPFIMPKTLDFEVLRTENLVMLSATAHTGSIADALESQPYIRYDPSTWGGLKAEQYIQDHNLCPDTLCDIDSFEAITVMVSKGMGVSLVPHWTGFNARTSHLSKTEIKSERYVRKIILVTPRNSPKITMIDKLKHYLLDH